MKADVKSLLNEFIGSTQGVQYVIPVYQRNYTWNKKHVQKLIDDIKNLLDDKTESHFIGSIVYVITSDIFNQREWAIVDGQQRLTTIFLLLYAIRDLLRENNKEQEAKSLTSQYLENVNSEGDYKLRLKPLVSNDEAFKKIVESDINNIDKSSLIYKNYNLLKETLQRWCEEYDINSILKAINKLYIIYIQLDKNDNAQQIFESINSTGETLKAPDLIRNYILMNKKDDEQTDYYTKYWRPIEENIQNNSVKLEEFFRFYIAIKKFDLINKNNLYEEFVSYWQDKNEKLLLEEILKYSQYYAQLYLDRTIDGIEKELTILKKIKTNMPTPLLMEFVKLFYDKKISKEQLAECINLIIIYLIRRQICELPTSLITRLFPSLLKSVLDKCNNNYSNIVDILKYYLVNQSKNKGSKMPTDHEIKESLKNINAYILTYTRVFFDVVEMESRIAIDYKNLTVEHIMPQTHTDYWKSVCGVQDEEYPKLVNLLGNLTLTDKRTNSKIGNKDFESKKKELKKVGKINLTSDVLEEDIWNKEKIEKRNKRLINLFIKLFPYYSSIHNYEEDNSKTIILENKTIFETIFAKALIYSNGEIELLPDSELKICDTRDSQGEEQLKELLDEGIAVELDDCYKLNQSVRFSSISTVTNFILGGNNNDCNLWKDDDGNDINVSLKKIKNK